MSATEKRKDIINHIKISDPSILQKIDKELDILEVTDGINDINNLDSFYDLWQKNIYKTGHKNNVNSWTAYALNLTDVKPDGEFLPFRRAFARAGFPDIDSDFDYFRRQEIYDYLIKRYGRENVGNIGTYSLLKLKSAIRRIGKALDVANAFHKGEKENKTLNEAKVKEIIDSLPPQRGAFLKVTDENGEDHTIKTIEDAYKYCPDFRKHIDKIPNFLKYAKDIEGAISNFGCLSKDTPILTNMGWIRIDEIDKDCKVAFLSKFSKICFSRKYISFCSGKKKMYKMKLKDGSYIKITDEHIVFTDKGCVFFEEVRKNPEKYKILKIKKENIRNHPI